MDNKLKKLIYDQTYELHTMNKNLSSEVNHLKNQIANYNRQLDFLLEEEWSVGFGAGYLTLKDEYNRLKKYVLKSIEFIKDSAPCQKSGWLEHDPDTLRTEILKLLESGLKRI